MTLIRIVTFADKRNLSKMGFDASEGKCGSKKVKKSK